MSGASQALRLARVLDKIEASLRDRPRDAYVVYVNAVHRDCLERRSFLQEIPRSAWSKTLERLMMRWPSAIYRAQSPIAD